MEKYDVIIIGAGFAGSVMANQYSKDNKKVLLIEKKNHIGGNAYDYYDDNGVLVHKYGPHLFHTNIKEVVDYLEEYSLFYPYEHRVLGYIDDKFVPIPFNLSSIEKLFPKDKAELLKAELIKEYGRENKVPILELRKSGNSDIRYLAEYIYEKVFKYYTMKQWDYSIEELSNQVSDRVPVFISYDDRYFQDQYQMMPKNGYTKLFENMLDNPNIDILLNTDSKDVLDFDFENKIIYYNKQKFTGKVIYTGLVDELMNYKYGKLEYRSLYFETKKDIGFYQEVTTCNYPTPKEIHPFTRITEYKHLMLDKPKGTTIHIEYPYPYDINDEKGNIPYYPLFRQDNIDRYEKYKNELRAFPNLILLGRLAEFKYYNMDAIIKAALDLYKKQDD